MRPLFVIEAPGKTNRFKAILNALGMSSANVVATSGHFFGHEEALSKIGIDEDLIEFGRTPKGPIVDRLLKAAAEASIVFVATDPDSEGDAIAHDVLRILGLDIECRRIRLSALTPSALKLALSKSTRIETSEAAPARARGLLDRLIGSTFSTGLPAGRVFSALLGSLAADKAPVAEMVVRLPAADGQRDFYGTAKLSMDEIEDAQASLEMFPTHLVSAKASARAQEAGDYAAVLRQVLRLPKTSVETSTQTFQSLYETGKISYFRTSGKTLGRDAIEKTRKLARQNGLRIPFEIDAPERTAEGHEAIHLMIETNLERNPENLPLAEAIPVIVGRLSLGAIVDETVEYAGIDGVPDDALWLFRRLKMHRINGTRRPGQQSESRAPGVHMLSQDAILLDRMLALGLGRPSTWSSHIAKAKERNILAADGGLTPHARDWARRTSPGLLDPKTAHDIEAICEMALDAGKDTEMPWRPVALAAFKRLPQSERLRIVEAIAAADRSGRANIGKSTISDRQGMYA